MGFWDKIKGKIFGEPLPEESGKIGQAPGREIAHELFGTGYGKFPELAAFAQPKTVAWALEAINSGRAGYSQAASSLPGQDRLSRLPSGQWEYEGPAGGLRFDSLAGLPGGAKLISIGNGLDKVLCVPSNDGFECGRVDAQGVWQSGFAFSERLGLARTASGPGNAMLAGIALAFPPAPEPEIPAPSYAPYRRDPQASSYGSQGSYSEPDDTLFMLMFPDLAPYMHPTSMRAWAIWYMHNSHGGFDGQRFDDGKVSVVMEPLGDGKYRAYASGPSGSGQFECSTDGQGRLVMQTENGSGVFDGDALSYSCDDGRSLRMGSDGEIVTSSPLSASELDESFRPVAQEAAGMFERAAPSEPPSGAFADAQEPVSDAPFAQSSGSGGSFASEPSAPSWGKESDTSLSTSY